MAHFNELNAAVLRLDPYTVQTAPAAASLPGSIIYITNNGGTTPVAAFSDGISWKVITLGLAIA